MSKRLLVRLLVLIGVAALITIWIARGSRSREGSGSKSPILVGAVLPLTGSAAVWGKNARNGIDLALNELNNAEPFRTRHLKVLYEDSRSDPKAAISALQKLITISKVPIVIGDIASSSVLAMAPIAQREKVVLLSPGASSPEISAAGDYIFRNWQSDALEGRVDAEFAYQKLGWRKSGILSVNNAYGMGLSSVFAEAFRSLGGEIVSEQSFSQGATDLRTPLIKLASNQLDGVFLPGYPPEMATALKQMTELGIHWRVLSVQAFDDPEILRRAGNSSEGVIFSVPTPPDAKNPLVARFQSEYKSKYGEDPGVCSDTGYDAITIIAAALQSGARTSEQLKTYLAHLKDFPGVAGKTSFDKNGDVLRDFSFMTISNLEKIPYHP